MRFYSFILLTVLAFATKTTYCQSFGANTIPLNLINELECEINLLSTVDTLDKTKIYELLQSSLDLKDTVAFFKLSLSVSKEYFYRLSKHEECIIFLEKSQGLLNDKESAAGSHYLHLGNHNLALGRSMDAMENFLKSLDWYKKYNPIRATIPLGNLAAIYEKSGDLDSALALNLEALTYSKLLPDRDSRLYNLTYDYATIADLYRKLGNMKLADDYFQKSLNTSIQLDSKNLQLTAIEQAISFYSAIDSNAYTQQLIDEGDHILQSSGHQAQIHTIDRFILNKSHHYLKMNQVEMAVHPTNMNENNVVAVNDHLEYAIRYYGLTNDKENEIIAYKQLLAKKNNDNNHNYSKIVSTVVENKEVIKDLNLNSEESLLNILTLKKRLIYLVVLILGLFASVFFYKRRSKRLENKIQQILNINTFNIGKLKKYQEASKQNKQYFTAVAHDIRSPMMKLKLLNEQLLSKERKDVDSLISESQLMNREIDTMLNQLEQFLFKQKKELTSIESIDLNLLFEDCTNLIDPTIIKPFNLEIIGSKFIECNRNGLKVILKNCIENSMKYCNNNLVKFVITVNSENKNCLFSIMDNNVENSANRITNPHNKVTKSNSKIESYGLGLEICKLSAERLGGWFKVDEQYEKGFKVDFSLRSSKI